MLGSWEDQEIDTIPLPSSQLSYPRGSTKVPIALYTSLWLDSVYKTVVVHLVWAQVPLPWDSSATVQAPAHPVQLTTGTTWGCEVTSLRPSEGVCRLGEPGRCQDYRTGQIILQQTRQQWYFIWSPPYIKLLLASLQGPPSHLQF